MRRRRLPAILLSTALIVGVVQAPASAAPEAPTAQTQPKPGTSRPSQVTLITGDRVTTTRTTASVRPGPGRQKIKFLTQRIGNHRYVIPSDAISLLRDGRLDKRLFDVDGLAPLGADLPLLITYPTNGASGARSAVAAGGARVTRDISAVGALAVRADLAGRASVWSTLTAGPAATRSLAPGVQRVWLDGKRKVSLDHSVPQIGAPEAWKAGYDGTGVTVAILDTGVDATHPDLAGQIAGAENFTDTPDTDDTVGHGTHVASIIAGTGAASNGRYRGVAPGAKLLIGKVCGTEYCDDSAILAGMAWAAEHAPVVNMSLGGYDTPETDPLEQAVDDLTARYNTLFVVAAGNDGAVGSVGSPSTADDALSIVPVDRDDKLAFFSSRGPRVGDHALKPEITAPGVDIVAAKAANGVIGDPATVDGYTTLSGTSMATPHVAGAAAILTQEHPAWSSRQRKTTLMGSAEPTSGVNAFDQGAGRVDVAREITQTVAVDEGALSFGLQVWPHGDDVPVTRTVTYRNSGTAAVDLTLTAPGAPFTVAATRLSVPAGGTASTTVTADTRGAGLPDGPIGAHLIATAAGGVRVVTPLGVDREVESYDLTVNTVNRDGTPSLDHVVTLYGLDSFAVFDAFQAAGTEKLRVPRGRYGVLSWVGVSSDESTSMLTQPELVVDRKLTIDVDARKAKPVRVTAPQAGAGVALATVNADWTLPDMGYSASLLNFSFDGMYSGRIGGAAKPFFLGSVNATFADPGAAADFRNSPYLVNLAYFSPGQMFTGLTRAPKVKDLATIKATYAASATGVEGVKNNVAAYTADSGGWSVLLPFDLPFRRTELLNTEAPWTGDFLQQKPPVGDEFPEQISELLDGRRPYQAGRTSAQDWNRGVLGPNLTQPPYPGLWVTRQADHLIADVPLFGDGAGHPGFSTTDTSTSTLYRGNTKIGEGYEFDLPPGVATYRLETTATRGAPHLLSSSVSGTWTFRSGHVGGTAYRQLPLSTVRFSPKLDDLGTAPAGRRFELPVTFEHQPGSGAGKLRSIKVEVSYDDGKRWQAAEVRGSGDHRTATVRHPRADGFASLRVTATDTKGNTVTSTVIRAYAIS
ncbi:S8 family serine peptidase [Micromonosporaceae bacterium Da 78-11]